MTAQYRRSLALLTVVCLCVCALGIPAVLATSDEVEFADDGTELVDIPDEMIPIAELPTEDEAAEELPGETVPAAPLPQQEAAKSDKPTVLNGILVCCLLLLGACGGFTASRKVRKRKNSNHL